MTPDMGPEHCKNWDYEKHPDAGQVPDRCIALLIDLARGNVEPSATVLDSRPTHRRLFKGLTPSACVYLAGHYRGEEFPSLKNYEIGVQGDIAVGTQAACVQAELSLFATRILAIFRALDAGSAVPNAVVSPEQKLLYLVCFAAEIHTEFLRVHPYANGNGHIGRFLVWCVLGKYGRWPRKWPFDERPGDPYVACLMDYRNGNRDPLIQLMLNAIVGD